MGMAGVKVEGINGFFEGLQQVCSFWGPIPILSLSLCPTLPTRRDKDYLIRNKHNTYLLSDFHPEAK